MEDAQAIREAIGRVPALAERGAPDAIEPLAGMTNRNFRLVFGAESFVLRIPGKGTEEYIDRKADAHAARIASEVGVGAELIHYDAATGVQVTRFIDGAVTMTGERLKADPGMVRRAALAFKRLHGCGRPFLTRFDNFRMMEDYLALLSAKGARLPEGYEAVKKEAEAVRAAFAANSVALVPCHCDPLPENLVDTGERAYILDWEYCGNNDPSWDLGDFAVESDFDEEQDRILLETYCGGPVPEAFHARVVLQKAMVFLLWTLWGVIQVANENPQPATGFASYWDYALDRFNRCQAIMNRPDFGALLECVRAP